MDSSYFENGVLVDLEWLPSFSSPFKNEWPSFHYQIEKLIFSAIFQKVHSPHPEVRNIKHMRE